MKKFCRYDKYKELKNNLLNEIPINWNMFRLKYVANIYNGNSLNDDYKLLFESENDDELPYIASKDINVETTEINYQNGTRIPRNFENLKIAPKNSSLLCIEGGSAGRKVGFTNQDVYFVNKLACFNVENEVTSKFIFYILQSNHFQSQFFNAMTGLIGGVSLSNIKNFNIPLPSIQEQLLIIKILDQQTSLIDEIISRKEKQIELLKDKRQAIINEAVTKGLNPNAKMKDSGIEWLGEIPEHWDTIKLKYLIEELESGVSVNSEGNSIEMETNEIGVLKTSCVFDYNFNPVENKKVIEEEINRVKCPVKANSIIISRMNTPDLVGASGYVDRDYENLFLPDRLWQTVFKKDLKFDIEFISYILISDIYKNLYGTIATGTSPSMKNISQSSFLEIPIPQLPYDEQIQIKNTLKKRKSEINEIIKLQIKSVEKLKEFRQSIISEAVTGKIDVKDWQPKYNLN
jgi:type I restriction enzyme, S subunit